MKNRISYWKDIFFQASGNSLAQLIGIIGLPILTRIYSPNDFAAQGIFIQIVTFLAAFITLRYEYFVPLIKNKKYSRKLIANTIIVGVINMIIFTILIFLSHTFFLKDNVSFSNSYYLAPATAFMLCISILFQHEAQRQEKFQLSAISEVFSKLFYVILGSFSYFFIGSIGLILTTLFGAIGKIFVLRNLIIGIQLKIKFDWYYFRKFFKHSANMVISNTLLSTTTLVLFMFISSYYGNEILGYYTLVISTIFLPSGIIGAAIGNVFYQRIGKLFLMNEYLQIKDIWRDLLKKLLLISIPLYLFLYYFSEELYPLIFGLQWSYSGELGRLMVFPALLAFISGPFDRVSLVFGKPVFLSLIHSLRFIAIMTVIICSYKFEINAKNFVSLLACVFSIVYTIDLFIGYMLIKSKEKQCLIP